MIKYVLLMALAISVASQAGENGPAGPWVVKSATSSVPSDVTACLLPAEDSLVSITYQPAADMCYWTRTTPLGTITEQFYCTTSSLSWKQNGWAIRRSISTDETTLNLSWTSNSGVICGVTLSSVY